VTHLQVLSNSYLFTILYVLLVFIFIYCIKSLLLEHALVHRKYITAVLHLQQYNRTVHCRLTDQPTGDNANLYKTTIRFLKVILRHLPIICHPSVRETRLQLDWFHCISWFLCVYKQMLSWLPTFQVATTCFSCSPPDFNLVVTNFILCIHVK